MGRLTNRKLHRELRFLFSPRISIFVHTWMFASTTRSSSPCESSRQLFKLESTASFANCWQHCLRASHGTKVRKYHESNHIRPVKIFPLQLWFRRFRARLVSHYLPWWRFHKKWLQLVEELEVSVTEVSITTRFSWPIGSCVICHTVVRFMQNSTRRVQKYSRTFHELNLIRIGLPVI